MQHVHESYDLRCSQPVQDDITFDLCTKMFTDVTQMKWVVKWNLIKLIKLDCPWGFETRSI